MPRKYRRSSQIHLLPERAFGWLLAGVAGLLALIIATLAYCMFVPVPWDGRGQLGALALSFPLHLLVATVVLLVLAFFARGCRAVIAATLFSLAMFATGVMAVAPAAMVWRQARQLGLPMSPRMYLDHARRWNLGRREPGRSVVYGTAKDGTNLELDVWRTGKPSTGPLRPAILMVHGGAWTHGHLGTTPRWNRWLNDKLRAWTQEHPSSAPLWNGWLNDLGYEVFDVEYSLPPRASWQDEVDYVKSALGWVASHAAEYHVDPARISAMGRFAGANLALLLAYSAGDTSTDAPQVAVRSVINLYGPTDLALLDPTFPAFQEYIGGPLEEFPDRYRALSPLTHVSANAPPTITVAGTLDQLVSTAHADLLNEALTKAGVPHETFLIPLSGHGFDVNWGGFATQIARGKIQYFLARYDPRPGSSE